MRFNNSPFAINKKGSKPLRTRAEFAAEVGISPKMLINLLAKRNGPTPSIYLSAKGKDIAWFSHAELKAWWAQQKDLQKDLLK